MATRAAPGEPAAVAGRSVATFRFYEELNDLLRAELRKRAFDYAFIGSPAVKDAIEAIGVPHTEVDLVLIDGESVGFGRHLRDGNRVAVYPAFERLDIASLTRLRPRPLRRSRFVLDVHLGTLARYLRLLGFDTLYRNDYDDAEIVRVAHDQGRIVLTRDRGLLKHRAVTRGRWIRSTQPSAQLRETLAAFDLAGNLRPFTRCAVCNGSLLRIDPRLAARLVPARVRERHSDFARCASCRRVYWPGTHIARIRAALRASAVDLPPAVRR
ncbi:MAG TPA: Mut7-C RNAse domain-containing protein [Casimicrobiaceae bacterium]|nr:Mut7-C RNAse domain-containing protein [Casimicrobiaceae bacterium]